MALPDRGEAYDFYVTLIDEVTGGFRVSPTIAAGDFQISKDGGAYVNLATLPSVLPAGSVSVKISLSAAEMTADKVTILGVDVAGAEWKDLFSFIDIPVSNIHNIWADPQALTVGRFLALVPQPSDK